MPPRLLSACRQKTTTCCPPSTRLPPDPLAHHSVGPVAPRHGPCMLFNAMSPLTGPHNGAWTRVAIHAAAGAILCALAGCAGPVPQRAHRPSSPTQAGAAALVLAPTDHWGGGLDQYADDADFSRRDL